MILHTHRMKGREDYKKVIIRGRREIKVEKVKKVFKWRMVKMM